MKNHSQRIDYIRKGNEAAKKEGERPTYPIKNWRGKNILYLKMIEVDVDYLMYRLENSRTEIQQLAYLRANPALPKTLFANPESSLAQDAQEAILTQINKYAGKDFLVDLQARGQDESAIITYDGYLINGNRRTAALKSLGERYIKCVVLPEDTTPKDIYELEQELQISQDFREPYHWINELRNIKRGLEDKRYEYKENEIADRLRIDIRDLKAKRRMLQLLDAFLIWKGIVGQFDYPKLEDTEQVFIQLEKAQKKYKDPIKSQELSNAVFTLIEQKPSKGRLYGYVMDLIKNFDQIYARFQAAQQATDVKNSSVPTESNSDSIIDDILGDDEIPSTSIFSNANDAEKLATSLVEKIADVKAENKEKTDNESVYQSISSALRELQGLSIDNDTSRLDSIKNKLEQIISTSTVLLEQLKTYEN